MAFEVKVTTLPWPRKAFEGDKVSICSRAACCWPQPGEVPEDLSPPIQMQMEFFTYLRIVVSR